MTRYLHVMYRITDPEKSRAFYEALGFEFRREVPIVRDGQLEATNYFFGVPGQDEKLELTYNHDGRTYDLGTGYGHIAIGVDHLDGTPRAPPRATDRTPAGAIQSPRWWVSALFRQRSGRLTKRSGETRER
jgi:catechol 2,3-dioxygenase-like lactoylglutathione lyase family enzyme